MDDRTTPKAKPSPAAMLQIATLKRMAKNEPNIEFRRQQTAFAERATPSASAPAPSKAGK
ncbi:hypothetical protein HMH01_08125 [Halovulum dunhuangense]|uniref:Uncharacterized protein n=1 Tax=Halovulum dunhuangense TaxID=1505036 RepID=A0A849L265_9RHOB|nr:hypothetical protein [Halovulum dunhuangense]NNU80406.1 hypothetical protein [Halovulum dunhuangense]